jgi:hypothetical protein
MKTIFLATILVFTSCGKTKEPSKTDPNDTAFGNMTGPAGPTGPTGPSGSPGPTGPQGAAGRDANYVPTDLSAASPTGNLSMAAAATYCRNLTESGYSDWHIPTIEELAPFFGTDADSNYVWTRTPSTNSGIYFIAARIDYGYLGADSNTAGKYARCVR